MTAASVVAGCSFKDRSVFFTPSPNEPTVTINNVAPRFGDTLSASAKGSVDPVEAVAVQYRFEWFVDDEIDPVHFEDLDEDQTSTLPNELVKGQRWTLVVTPFVVDAEEESGERLGRQFESEIVVRNTPPTLTTAGLDNYAPIADEVLRAFSIGVSDVDAADTASTEYTWKLSDGQTFTTVDNGEIDLRTAFGDKLADPEGSSLTLEVEVKSTDGDCNPIDEDEDNRCASATVGPVAILNDVTRWKQLTPNLLLRRTNPFILWGAIVIFDGGHSFVSFDERHERFLIQNENELWEYTEVGGFVQLFPTGEGPINVAQTHFDGTAGQERLIVLSGEPGKPDVAGAPGSPAEKYEVHSLDVSTRGKESWTKFAVTGGPDVRCYPLNFIDAPRDRVFVMGGLLECDLDKPANDGLWELALSTGAPTWVQTMENPGLTDSFGRFGATAVQVPEQDKIFLVGGYLKKTSPSASWTPANVIGFTLVSDQGAPLLVAEEGNVPVSDGWGPLAFYDNTNNRIIGGLTLDLALTNNNSTWFFSIDEAGWPVETNTGPADTVAPDNDWFADFNVEDRTLHGTGRGALGVVGRMGDEVFAWPGYSARQLDDLTSAFQLFKIGNTESSESLKDPSTWSSHKTMGEEFPAPSIGGASRVDNDRLWSFWGDFLGDEARPLGMQKVDLSGKDFSVQTLPFVPSGNATARANAGGFMVTPTSTDDGVPFEFDPNKPRGSRFTETTFEDAFPEEFSITASTNCPSVSRHLMQRKQVNDPFGFDIEYFYKIATCTLELQDCTVADVDDPEAPFTGPSTLDSGVAAVAATNSDTDEFQITEIDLCAEVPAFSLATLTGEALPAPNALQFALASFGKMGDAAQNQEAFVFLDGFSEPGTFAVRQIMPTGSSTYDVSTLNVAPHTLLPIGSAIESWDENRKQLIVQGGGTTTGSSTHTYTLRVR